MEAIPTIEGTRNMRLYQGVTLLLAIVITCYVLLVIVFHWRDLAVIQKGLAVVLMLNLVVDPVLFRLREKKGRNVEPGRIMQFAYICLGLLAMLLGLR